MTIAEAISKVDALVPNTYAPEDKIRWLSALDSRVKTQIIDTHQQTNPVYFYGYNGMMDTETELLVKEPYDEMYLRWLEAQIHYHNGEYGKYNNAIDMFNTTYEDYKRHYNRTHMPKGKQFKYF